MPYTPPPLLEKPYIFALSEDEFISYVGKKLPCTWQEFAQQFSNVPKFLSSIFAPEMPSGEFWTIINNIKQKIAQMKMNPGADGKNIFYDENKKCLSLIENPDAVSFPTVNEAFTYYYEHKCVRLQLKQIKSQIIRGLEKKAGHLKQEIQKHDDKLQEMKDAEKWQVYGELLKIHLGEIEKGQKEIQVKNYFVDKVPYVIIPLKPEWTPQKNMKYYFRQYQKAKSGANKLYAHISHTKAELKKVLEKISRIQEIDSLEDISKFSQDFHEEKKHSKSESLPFRNFPISVGRTKWNILVGKSSKQNDELTIKFAKPYDWFFHSRIYHGAHVIVQNPEKRESLPQQVIQRAASIAVYYSKAKHSTKVPVDYTQVRYVSKPRKAPPGMVVYKNHKTLFVNPVNPQAKDPA
jgi:predicted ribosome quality control (RQC) complex YloA/Tae2 family protein